MFYHNITKDDMLNGDGLRVVLWTSGCSHHCNECQNPITWNPDDGIEFNIDAENEIFEQLDKSYISGITFSGGDPLHENNLEAIHCLINKIKTKYGNTKTIWLYTGYCFEEIINEESITNSYSSYQRYLREIIIKMCDVLVDGRFVKELKDEQYHWAGSTNQRVIDVQKSLLQNCIVLYKS